MNDKQLELPPECVIWTENPAGSPKLVYISARRYRFLRWRLQLGRLIRRAAG
jgi:hypothetical protein